MKDKDGCWEIGGGNNLGGLCGPQLYWSWLNEVPEGHRDWMVQSWQCMLPARWMNSLINTQTCTSQESATSAYDGLKRHTAFDLMHCNQCKTLQQRQQGFVLSNLLIEWVWCRKNCKNNCSASCYTILKSQYYKTRQLKKKKIVFPTLIFPVLLLHKATKITQEGLKSSANLWCRNCWEVELTSLIFITMQPTYWP